MKTHTATLALLAAATTGHAAITITDGTSAPTYDVTLNFDEAGGPTGSVPADSWAGIGLADIISGEGSTVVGDNNQLWGINDGNSFYGAYGVFMTFSTDLTNFSAQIWDPSGPPSPFGGGAGVFVYNNGTEVANYFYEPAWGGLGNEWLDISADGGMVFDEIRILGYGFFPTTYMDNASWTPAPGAAALLSCVGLGALRRRRR
ncbi:MAG: hypothetical protein KDA21_02910 [Phycisphaerales bacterium]|nr:hypothetical protein [Phycisphaerales bacterium]MCB1218925.1 hypothetical protein [bacterium]